METRKPKAIRQLIACGVGGAILGSIFTIATINTIAIVCGLIYLFNWLGAPAHYDADKLAIQARYTEFYESYQREDYETAYIFTSPKYRQDHGIDEFIADYGFLGNHELHLNHSIKFSDNKAYLSPWNPEIILSGPELELEKIDGVWYFTGEYEWYYH